MDEAATPVHPVWPGARMWRRFARSHLHDYNRRATHFWLAIQGCGALALAWSFVGLAGLGLNDWWQVLGWTTIAVLAAGFPIQIPRSKHSIATGDTVIFLLLALHGAAAATAAAALGRSSRRAARRCA